MEVSASAGNDNQPENERVNPDLETLYSMFPSLDRDVVSEVYLARGQNLDLAVPSLLELSDPSATNATEPNIIPVAGTQLTSDEEYAKRIAQAEGDEELARRLQYEEQRRTSAGAQHDEANPQEESTMDTINRNLEELDQKLSRVGDKVGVAVESAASSVKQWFGNMKTKLANAQDGSNTQTESNDQRYQANRFQNPVSEEERKQHSSQYAALLDEAEDEESEKYEPQPLRSAPLSAPKNEGAKSNSVTLASESQAQSSSYSSQ